MKGSHHFREETDLQKLNGERRKCQSAGTKENISFSQNSQNMEQLQNKELKTTTFTPAGHLSVTIYVHILAGSQVFNNNPLLSRRTLQELNVCSALKRKELNHFSLPDITAVFIKQTLHEMAE